MLRVLHMQMLTEFQSWRFMALFRSEWRSACARNVSFETLSCGQFTISSQLITLNYPVILFHRHCTTFSLETYPLYSLEFTQTAYLFFSTFCFSCFFFVQNFSLLNVFPTFWIFPPKLFPKGRSNPYHETSRVCAVQQPRDRPLRKRRLPWEPVDSCMWYSCAGK